MGLAANMVGYDTEYVYMDMLYCCGFPDGVLHQSYFAYAGV